MASAKEGFDEDPLESFTRLIGSGEDTNLCMAGAGSFVFPAENTPKMLCFGRSSNQRDKALGEYGMIAQRSSSSSSSNHSSSSSFSKSNSQRGEAKIEQKKRNGSELVSVPASSLVSGASGGSRKRNKKAQTENTTTTGPAKGRKEKLGERITALQQLVSPFGKTDTASILHETMGYIRFLEDQVQVLSSPYLQRLPWSGPVNEGRGKEEEAESRYDLRSRGLCLVPVACTVQVANSNGADFWSPAMALKLNSNSSKQ
ncbi:hypothetical protein NE237_016394 [Protea cynaroides]|uniref:BHLH domain-containing protein n=1 Tax=Protea cynaroides TaxID=273540 RepID=A0A9Q0HEY2_9MAGN|nr:hypothetical protein NE237_016394 [Protea cynaroides]